MQTPKPFRTPHSALRILLLCPMLAACCLPAFAQGTAFTYQGRLDDGANAANGIYDLRFTIYDSSGGAGVIAGPITNSPVAVSNGLFNVTLDFGAGVFAGSARWLEIGVRTNGGGALATLTPRQQLTPTPYAFYAPNAGAAASAIGVATDGVTTVSLQNSAVTSAKVLDGTLTAADVDAASFSSTFWKVDGNAGTTAGTHFMGTSDNQPLEIKVNGLRAFRIEPDAETPNIIGGAAANFILPGAKGSTIAGGGLPPYPNQITADFATIGGGTLQIVDGDWATIAGGRDNRASSESGFIGGGRANLVETNAEYGVVAGGYANQAQSGAFFSTIGGGQLNTIQSGSATIAGGAGHSIQANSDFGTISGGNANDIGSGSQHAAISGGLGNQIRGGSPNTIIAGGAFNEVAISADHTAISGGYQNFISTNADFAAVGGGYQNRVGANAFNTVIGGGSVNTVEDGAYNASLSGGQSNRIAAAALSATVSGGLLNSIKTNGHFATIPGGEENTATNYAFAAGRRAKAISTGAFVWADSTDADFASTANNEYAVRASGGVRFETSGAGMTVDGLPMLSGLVGTAQLANGAVTAAKISSVDASTITSGTVPTAALGNVWQTGGNAGTTAGLNFLGTTDNQPLEFKANGLRVLRLEPTAGGANIIAGSSANSVEVGVTGATIAGGELNTIGFDANRSVIGGGNNNIIADDSFSAVIAGGGNNDIGKNANSSVIGGGTNNIILDGAIAATIAGGWQNNLHPNAHYGVIGGGYSNTVSGDSATVSGGYTNIASGFEATVGGGQANVANGYATTVSGGRFNNASGGTATVSGGLLNTASGLVSTVSGGEYNTASDWYATVSGGHSNTASGASAAVSGGFFNFATGTEATVGGGRYNLANGSYATVGGGTNNGANGINATVCGGANNAASGDSSFAAGYRAKAIHDGAFVWADSMGLDVVSDRANQFKVRANGGVYLSGNGNNTAPQLHVAQTGPDFVRLRLSAGTRPFWDIAAGGGNNVLNFFNETPSANIMTLFTNGNVSISGSLSQGSDRNRKEDIRPISPSEMLARVIGLPLATWRYKSDAPEVTHVGPMAQDFHAAFGLNGTDDKHIATVDADGVALAAIQGLNQKIEARGQRSEVRSRILEERLEQKETEITELKRHNQSLEQRLAALERVVLSQSAK